MVVVIAINDNHVEALDEKIVSDLIQVLVKSGGIC